MDIDKKVSPFTPSDTDYNGPPIIELTFPDFLAPLIKELINRRLPGKQASENLFVDP